MIRDAANFIELISHNLTFVSCVMIFLGGGYIALHSREVPKWAATGLWYIGLAALLNAITILIDWTLGQMHPMSHFQIGVATETLLSMSIAGMVALLFFNTVWKDYLGSKVRQNNKVPAVKAAAKKPAIRSSTPVIKTTTKRRPRTIKP